MTQKSDGRVRIDMTPVESSRFLRNLASNDDFRAELTANPQKVLKEYGIEVNPDVLEAGVTLPAKHEIRTVSSAVNGQYCFGIGHALRSIGRDEESRRDPGEFQPGSGEKTPDEDDVEPGWFAPNTKDVEPEGQPGWFGSDSGERRPGPGEFQPHTEPGPGEFQPHTEPGPGEFQPHTEPGPAEFQPHHAPGTSDREEERDDLTR